ncbi:MAG: enoyl-CoA hydratase [Pelagibacterales bacterium]|nr:enoyl-CoA hydratase [Pelagibacterales bacterium]RCL83499.1 MAG: enoyl-CoA hydratase [Alphaproteobacteria bacterium]|tara:strand:+ start:881 stop:1669 length:789 start_codon:yes stop_codon:yes gene_type:complete
MSLDINNLLNYTEEDTIAILTLNRPNQQNALSTDLMRALVSKLDKIKNNKNIKVVTLFANGNNFCAGHDLKELKLDRSEKRFKEIFELCSQLMTRIVKLPKPVIAGVQGIATAAGCQLVASCDLAIAAKNATFATPGVNIGLFCSTPMVAVSRNVSKKRTMEMLLMGNFINANKALDFGLINNVVEDKKLKDETLKIAKNIATKSTATVAIGKEAFYKQLEMSLEDAYAYTSKVMSSNMLEKDAQEGISAFIENRDPIWSDK